MPAKVQVAAVPTYQAVCDVHGDLAGDTYYPEGPERLVKLHNQWAHGKGERPKIRVFEWFESNDDKPKTEGYRMTEVVLLNSGRRKLYDTDGKIGMNLFPWKKGHRAVACGSLGASWVATIETLYGGEVQRMNYPVEAHITMPGAKAAAKRHARPDCSPGKCKGAGWTYYNGGLCDCLNKAAWSAEVIAGLRAFGNKGGRNQ